MRRMDINRTNIRHTLHLVYLFFFFLFLKNSNVLLLSWMWHFDTLDVGLAKVAKPNK